MRTETSRVFEIAHDSGDRMHEAIRLADWINDNTPDVKARFEGCKSDFGYIVIEQVSEK
jgi:hypothetical protein